MKRDSRQTWRQKSQAHADLSDLGITLPDWFFAGSYARDLRALVIQARASRARYEADEASEEGITPMETPAIDAEAVTVSHNESAPDPPTDPVPLQGYPVDKPLYESQARGLFQIIQPTWQGFVRSWSERASLFPPLPASFRSGSYPAQKQQKQLQARYSTDDDAASATSMRDRLALVYNQYMAQDLTEYSFLNDIGPVWVMSRFWYDQLRKETFSEADEQARARQHASAWWVERWLQSEAGQVASAGMIFCPACGEKFFLEDFVDFPQAADALCHHVRVNSDPKYREPRKGDVLFAIPIRVRADAGFPEIRLESLAPARPPVSKPPVSKPPTQEGHSDDEPDSPDSDPDGPAAA